MRYLIVGGTGTLGRALIRELLEKPDSEIRCVSRCELKQKELKDEFKSSRLTCYLGDVKDISSLHRPMAGVDVVFHVAALKHVDTGEYNPEETIKTNVLGTINVADACEQAGVKYCVFSSTDKAVEPINLYGMTKAISEKVLLRRNRVQTKTQYAVYRWGNVTGSRGSAIPIFLQAIRSNKPIPITDFEMTRFWIRIEDAVSFMLKTYQTSDGLAVMIPPIKAASVTTVVEVLAKLDGKNAVEFEKVGLRPGEKIHEALESGFYSDIAPQYTHDELELLLKDFV